MGLFGDLPSAKDEVAAKTGASGGASETPGKDGAGTSTTPGAGGGWSGAGAALRAPPRKSPALVNPAMLKAQAAALRAQQAKLARMKDSAAASASTPHPDAAPASASKTPGAKPTPGVSSAAATADARDAAGWGTLSADVDEEYDPRRPNSYEDVVRDRARRRAKDEATRAREKQRVELERRRARLERDRNAAGGRGGAIDRSSLRVTGEEAHARRARIGRDGFLVGGHLETADGAGPGGASTSGGGGKDAKDAKEPKMTPAQRMMMKMGWKEGQGLGKSDQGMTTPLMAEKRGAKHGVIVNAPEMFFATGSDDEKAGLGGGSGVVDATRTLLGAPKFVSSRATEGGDGDAVGASPPPARGPPSKVLLLRNMIGPGEVDEDLEDEVAEECEKHGAVHRVMIFEVTESGYDPREAVRIFVEFTKPEDAAKCANEMDGRFFGGRTVAASHYDEGLFEANELGPQPGERAIES